MMLPDRFLDQMKRLLKEDFQDFVDTYDAPRHYGLRRNPLKYSGELPYILNQVPWCETGYYYSEEDRPGKNPLYSAGAYYIQEPSAMTPGAAVEAEEGDWVIDLCAAPGGKSTQVAADLGGQGLLVSNDISPSRVKSLNRNIQTNGIRNAIVMSEDPVKLAQRWPNLFDRVLVDAPCSGEGMFRKEPKLIDAWLNEGPEGFVPIQRQILTAAYDLLKPGGTLVYSTCTYNLEENEENMLWFLETYKDCSLEPIAHKLQISNGFDPDASGRGESCARVWPHLHKGEGHFIARLHKGGEPSGLDYLKEKATMTKEALEALETFMKDVGILEGLCPLDRLNLVKDTIYLLPEQGPAVKGIRTFANGWLLGRVKKGRFEPSQAFANGLLASEVGRVVDWAWNDDNALRYLKGETVSEEVPNGWHLISVEGAGMGWAKAVNKRLKNKLEPTWRWQ